ncbi:hypothetical protein BJ085DRAFT_32195 [Dimargaris cristalligena]|uniref:Uncharacterized protein n=1 Tax=Dimargaris cristalligena TaxID=215637 RepID=A0A4V1J410_9FUNG|nr:hypothetical protein BJ085DRAFT_32195 [Dimargaris cristalligena]|eukprot:RKP33929.1 hypothetical protein BJ085DRAFT_32195 [Dimargaris cristalligena]
MCPIFSRYRPLAYATVGMLFALVVFTSVAHASPAPKIGEAIPVLGLWDPLNGPAPTPSREPLPFADIQDWVRQRVEQIVNSQVESTPMMFKKMKDPIPTALEIVHVRWCGITRRYLVWIQRRISSKKRVGGESLTLQVSEIPAPGPPVNGGAGQTGNGQPLTNNPTIINEDEVTEFITRKLTVGKAPDMPTQLFFTFRDYIAGLSSLPYEYNEELREFRFKKRRGIEWSIAAKIPGPTQWMAFGRNLQPVEVVDLTYGNHAGTTVGYPTHREIRAYATTRSQEKLEYVSLESLPALTEKQKNRSLRGGNPTSIVRMRFSDDSRGIIETTRTYLTGGKGDAFFKGVKNRIADRIDILSKYGFGTSSRSGIEGREASDEPLQFTMYISLTKKPRSSSKWWNVVPNKKTGHKMASHHYLQIDRDQPTVAHLFYFVDSENPEAYDKDMDNPHLIDHFLFNWFTERHLGGIHLKLTLAPPSSSTTSLPTAESLRDANMCTLTQSSKVIVWALSDLFALLVDDEALFGQRITPSPFPTGNSPTDSSRPDLNGRPGTFSSQVADNAPLDNSFLPRITFARQYTTTEKRSIRPGPFSTETEFMKRTLDDVIVKSAAYKSPLIDERLVMVQDQVITNFGLHLYSILGTGSSSTERTALTASNNRQLRTIADASPQEYILMLMTSIIKSLPCNPSLPQFQRALLETNRAMGARIPDQTLETLVNDYLKPLKIE